MQPQKRKFAEMIRQAILLIKSYMNMRDKSSILYFLCCSQSRIIRVRTQLLMLRPKRSTILELLFSLEHISVQNGHIKIIASMQTNIKQIQFFFFFKHAYCFVLKPIQKIHSSIYTVVLKLI